MQTGAGGDGAQWKAREKKVLKIYLRKKNLDILK